MTKVQVIDQAYCLRILMNVIALLPERKLLPLLFGQLQYESAEFGNINIAYMNETASKIHGLFVDLSGCEADMITAEREDCIESCEHTIVSARLLSGWAFCKKKTK